MRPVRKKSKAKRAAAKMRPAAAKPTVHKERAKTRREGGKASRWPAGLESAVRKEVMHWRNVSDCMDDHQEFGSAHHWRCPMCVAREFKEKRLLLTHINKYNVKGGVAFFRRNCSTLFAASGTRLHSMPALMSCAAAVEISQRGTW